MIRGLLKKAPFDRADGGADEHGNGAAQTTGVREILVSLAIVAACVAAGFIIFDLRSQPRWLSERYDLASAGLLGGILGLLVAFAYCVYRRLNAEIVRSRRAETAASLDEQRFHDFAEIASHWLWERGPDGHVTYFGGGSLGRAIELPDGTVGMADGDIMGSPAIDDIQLQEIERQIAAREAFVDLPLTTRIAGSGLAHLLVSGRPIFDEARQFVGYRGSTRNVTHEVVAQRQSARRHAELTELSCALKASEERFRDFSETSSDWFWEQDENLRFTFVSSANQRFSKTRLNSQCGQTRRETRPLDVSEEQWANHEADLAAHLPFSEFRYARVDDNGRKRYLSTSGKPFFGPEGNFRGYRGTTADVTARVEAEQAVLRSERRFRDFAEASSHYVWETDVDRRLTYVSDGVMRVTGERPEEMIGRRRADMMASQPTPDPLAEAIAGFVARREAYMDLPFSRRIKNGTVAQFEISAKPFYSEAGEFLGYRGATRDVTSQIEARNEVAEARRRRDVAEAGSRVKSQFLANMSHELRTPLNAIIGFSEIMDNELLGPIGTPKYREFVQDIHASGKRLLDIVSEILDMSHIEVGHYTVKPEAMEIKALVAESVAMTRRLANNAVLTVHTAGVASDAWLFMDRRATKQVLINLLSNAIKFTPRGGRIEIAAMRTADGVTELRVSDTGRGIPANRLTAVLEPFQQADASQAREQGGAGIGLWFSRELMRLQGGDLRLESVLGQGTTAIATFPADLTVSIRQPDSATADDSQVAPELVASCREEQFAK